jgi:hypothetical protein
MHWLLQENIFNEAAWGKLIETFERFDIPYSEHKVIPFIGELLPEPPDDKNIICFGSYSMRHSAKKYGWTPGVFDLQDQSFDKQLIHWGDNMLNADSQVCKFKDAQWTAGEQRFVRPCDDSKYFAGAVFEWEEFMEWQKNVCVLELDYGNSLTPDTMIQIAPLKKIYTEYRCWVVNGRIVTCSLYKRGNRVVYENMDGDVGHTAREFASKFLVGKPAMPPYSWEPAAAFCLDVCETSEGWKIVEINTINSCGFYAADIQKLVLTLNSEF